MSVSNVCLEASLLTERSAADSRGYSRIRIRQLKLRTLTGAKCHRLFPQILTCVYPPPYAAEPAHWGILKVAAV